jgi:hypothetical protein
MFFLRLLIELVPRRALGAAMRALATALGRRFGVACEDPAGGPLSPDRARSLLTVRAAISFARPSDVPRFSALSLMCSY